MEVSAQRQDRRAGHGEPRYSLWALTESGLDGPAPGADNGSHRGDWGDAAMRGSERLAALSRGPGNREAGGAPKPAGDPPPTDILVRVGQILMIAVTVALPVAYFSGIQMR